MVAAAGLGAAGAGAGGAAAASSSSRPVLKIATVSISTGGKTVKRSVLVNGAGHTVYMLSGDSSKHAKCASSGCLAIWPAVSSSAKHPVVGKGVTGRITIWHHNNLNQVTINGHPVYTYAGDSGSGQTGGEGLKSFGGTWSVVNGAGNAPSLSSSSGSSGGGYGY
jgi:predicted lipoprotein with Yx(FWY)xxD motif